MARMSRVNYVICDITATWAWSTWGVNPRMRDLIDGCHFRSAGAATSVADG